MPVVRSVVETPAVRRAFELALVLLLVGAPAMAAVAASRAEGRGGNQGAITLTGDVVVSNPLLQEAFSEPLILLSDLSNFVARDIDGEPPAGAQVSARLIGELGSGATFSLALPIAPPGTPHRFGAATGDDQGEGVRVFSVELNNNVVGEPFFGPFEVEQGWGTAYSSLRVAPGTYEVTGGTVVAWAATAGAPFAAGFGPDGKLFTADDPLAPLAAGWTVVDLDQEPFARERGETVDVPIIEGGAGLKDLSGLSYTAAFDAVVGELRVRYPFTEEKGLDWDALVEEFRPQVAAAEAAGDGAAFRAAMARFALRFGDGHVAVAPQWADLRRRYGGGAGLVLGRTDDGTVVAGAVTRSAAAAAAGIEPGAEILRWGGQGVAAALAAQELVRSASSPHVAAAQRLRLLAAGPVGATVEVVYRNPGGEERTAQLELVDDRSALRAVFASSRGGPAELPVTVEVLPSGIGYVRVTTFLADLALLAASWEWAIERLDELGVPAVIVDVRGNLGGAGLLATYFAGSFTVEPFDLAEFRFADPSGELVFSSTLDVKPTPSQWEKPVAVLIDGACASACEIFAAAVARDPSHLIVGQEPTAGVMASIFPWRLPAGVLLQAPLGRLETEGGVFLEGSGVAPTLRVPVTVASLTTGGDPVLAAAERALAGR